MDRHQLDLCAQTQRSRRTLLGGLAGTGLAALLGLKASNRAEGHNFLARCRRITHQRRRQACLRRARAHNAAHQRATTPPRPTAVPTPLPTPTPSPP
jgi:hypothetical protein